MRDTEEKLKLKFHVPSIDYFALTFGSFKWEQTHFQQPIVKGIYLATIDYRRPGKYWRTGGANIWFYTRLDTSHQGRQLC